MPPVTRLSVRLLWPYLAALRAREVDLERLLRRAGLQWEVVMDPDARIPHDVGLRLLDLAVQVSACPTLGLEAARWSPWTKDGILEQLSDTAATMRQGAERFYPATRLLHDALDMRIEVTDDLVISSVALRPDLRYPPAAVDFGLASMVTDFARFGAVPPRVRWVEFAYPEPNDLTPYRDFFQAPLRFEAPRNAVAFDRRDYESTPTQPNPRVHATLRRLVEQRLRETVGSTLRDQVLAVLRRSMLPNAMREPGGGSSDFRTVPGAAPLARSFGMSEATLRRRLADEGTSLRSLTDQARTEVAQRLLADERWSVQQIADLLGFTHAPAFHRAFKRWTGQTPGEYRLGHPPSRGTDQVG